MKLTSCFSPTLSGRYVDQCRAVSRATHILLNQVLPRFAAELPALVNEGAEGGATPAAEWTPVSGKLRHAMHQRGLNMRHLGLLFANLPPGNDRWVALVPDSWMVRAQC